MRRSYGGDDGDKFYLLEGAAAVRVSVRPGEPEREVRQHAKGGSFGERALLTDEPRGASAVATWRCWYSFLLKGLATHAALRARLEDAMEKYPVVCGWEGTEDPAGACRHRCAREPASARGDPFLLGTPVSQMRPAHECVPQGQASVGAVPLQGA